MKKWWIVCLIAVIFTGCGRQEVFETVSDEYVTQVMAQPREISVRLPEESAMSAEDGEGTRVYLSNDYEIIIETLPAGDLDATVVSLCGLDREAMTLVQTQWGEIKRYDFVWTSAGEMGERLGRGVILDDGTYHYCMTALRDMELVNKTQIVWSDVFNSFSLGKF